MPHQTKPRTKLNNWLNSCSLFNCFLLCFFVFAPFNRNLVNILQLDGNIFFIAKQKWFNELHSRAQRKRALPDL